MPRVTLPLLAALALAACGEKEPDGDSDPGGDSAPVEDSAEDTGEDSGAVDLDGDGASAEEDCDDENPDRYPGNTELCDGVDNDCDGLIDDEDGEVEGAPTWYVDADGDGYGSDVGAVEACSDPSDGGASWVEAGGDCEDEEASVFPGAEVVCGDGLVNDCAGSEAEEEAACAWPEEMTTGDADGAASGDSSDMAVTLAHGDWDGDGLDELALGTAVTDSHLGYQQGAVTVWDGPLSGSMDLEEDGVRIEADSLYDQLGWGLASAPDLDGDGADELLAGAPHASTQAYYGGAVYLLDDPFTAGSVGDAAVATWGSSTMEAYLGSGIAPAGDQDGDGVAELLLGAVGRSETGEYASGAVYLVSGADRGAVDADAEALAQVYGVDYVELVGAGPSMDGRSNLNGDGLDDPVIGGPGRDFEEGIEGAAYVFYGPLSGLLSVVDADAIIQGGVKEGFFGAEVVGGFDLDGDGLEDLAASAPQHSGDASGQGAVFFYAGDSGGLDPSDGPALTVLGEEEDLLGGRFDLGDLDGDGRPDLVTGSAFITFYGGASYSYGDGATEVRVFRGLATGTLTAEDADHTIAGDSPAFGTEVSFAGDSDGDGREELAVVEDDSYYGSPTLLRVWESSGI